MRIRIIWTIAATLLLTTTGPGEAAGTQVRARFAFDALATCTQPPVQAFPVHAEGTAMLSVDRTATLDGSGSSDTACSSSSSGSARRTR